MCRSYEDSSQWGGKLHTSKCNASPLTRDPFTVMHVTNMYTRHAHPHNAPFSLFDLDLCLDSFSFRGEAAGLIFFPCDFEDLDDPKKRGAVITI